MYTISPELYGEAAERLCDAIGSQNYFSGTITFPFAGMECRLTASVIVYRERVSLPEGAVEAISNLVPVWWEFHTYADGGEIINDFSFSDLKEFVR